MSLIVYLTQDEIPQDIRFIDRNDAFFGYTMLKNSEFERNVLAVIDHAKYASGTTFTGRTEALGSLFKDYLSTGTKTLLNIYNHQDICFDVLECGDNALEMLCDLHCGQILWRKPFFYVTREDESCDIVCRDIHFTNIVDFMDWARKFWDV